MILHTFSDGGARGNPGPAAIGVIIATPDGKIIHEFAECIGHATNNVAEYRAMLKAIELARSLHATELLCHADSELIIFQLQGVYRIKDSRLAGLAEKVKSAASGLTRISWKQIPRESPMIVEADRLLNQALNKARATAPLKPQPGDFF